MVAIIAQIGPAVFEVLLIDIGKKEALLLIPISNLEGNSGSDPFLYAGLMTGGVSPASSV